MERFLESVGSKVVLSEHTGYRGGLDTQFGQTGQHSFYTEHLGKEVMFHVATLLPFSETDSQQLQRKRHIGNDIVAVVFQEGDTPFSPDIVTSHFLHAYILVRPDPADPGTVHRTTVSCTVPLCRPLPCIRHCSRRRSVLRSLAAEPGRVQAGAAVPRVAAHQAGQCRDCLLSGGEVQQA